MVQRPWMMIPGRPTAFANSLVEVDLHRVAGGLGVAEGLVGVEGLGDLGVGLALAQRLVEAVRRRLLADVLDALGAADERGHVLLDDQLAAGVAGLGAGDDRDAGGALAHADRRCARVAQLHPGLDRAVEVEVLLAVQDRAEQLARDHLHARHPGGLEGGHDREHRRRDLAARRARAIGSLVAAA